MVEQVPGFVPQALSAGNVSLFRAEDRVFEAMLEGWRSQMLAQGLATATIHDRLRLLYRFQAHVNDYPWNWLPGHFDEFAEDRRSGPRPVKVSTLRSDSAAVRMFCYFVSNPAYGWVSFCEKTFDSIPAQIVFDWNSPTHSAEDDVPTGKRAFTITELNTLFNVYDDMLDAAHAKRSKRWRGMSRNAIAFKLCYAYGLRRRELSMLELSDFGPNPHIPDYGMFGALRVRWGKGTKASGPRRRTVLTVPEFDWVVPLIEKWLSPGFRDGFSHADSSLSLWPTERGPRVGLGTFGDAFVEARRAAGLPEELGMHCLRHSYVTHLIEAGADPAFVQAQVGHAAASTTGLYTSVGDDFKQKALQQMIAKRLRLGKAADEGRTA